MHIYIFCFYFFFNELHLCSDESPRAQHHPGGHLHPGASRPRRGWRRRPLPRGPSGRQVSRSVRPRPGPGPVPVLARPLTVLAVPAGPAEPRSGAVSPGGRTDRGGAVRAQQQRGRAVALRRRGEHRGAVPHGAWDRGGAVGIAGRSFRDALPGKSCISGIRVWFWLPGSLVWVGEGLGRLHTAVKSIKRISP